MASGIASPLVSVCHTCVMTLVYVHVVLTIYVLALSLMMK